MNERGSVSKEKFEGVNCSGGKIDDLGEVELTQ